MIPVLGFHNNLYSRTSIGDVVQLQARVTKSTQDLPNERTISYYRMRSLPELRSRPIQVQIHLYPELRMWRPAHISDGKAGPEGWTHHLLAYVHTIM